MRYFVNNIVCGWNLFLVLIANNSSSIHFERPKEEIYIYIYIKVNPSLILENKNTRL